MKNCRFCRFAFFFNLHKLAFSQKRGPHIEGINFLGIEENSNGNSEDSKLTLALLNSSYESDKMYEGIVKVTDGVFANEKAGLHYFICGGVILNLQGVGTTSYDLLNFKWPYLRLHNTYALCLVTVKAIVSIFYRTKK